MPGGPQGFYRATVTKTVVLVSVVGYVFVTAFRASKGWHLDVTNTIRGLQLWRMATSSLVGGSVAETAVAAYLLYQFRTIERQMGGRAFASMLLWTAALAVSFQMAGLIVFPSVARVAPGPYAAVFALFTYYYRYVPKLRPNSFRVLGVTFSDKTFTYIAGLQLACCDGIHSLLPAVAGLAAGLVHSSENIGLREWLLPETVASACSSVCSPLLASEAPGAAAARRRRQQQQLQAAYEAQLAR
eukprot:CAMPEP_0203808468 /NCGR_PEP_ID=MMETSP0115-20131106/1641_1 /ASSEMBLY_ACC=CAM_ASM_000227 /TAXON_ID=33651 /ORGANISM="Bicosoecid sp, Strain ms1" /LENGTH=242 /DNA_ID=CAMNT_0050717157 /DNA_START=38 /DNA_END=762 /DNA_ORIENTATION=-